jgi:hypothetical protein
MQRSNAGSSIYTHLPVTTVIQCASYILSVAERTEHAKGDVD